MSQQHNEDKSIKLTSKDLSIVSQDSGITTRNEEETARMISDEECDIRLQKAFELQCAGQEYIANLAGGLNDLSQNVDNLKNFIEPSQGSDTIDFPDEHVSEFNKCLASISRIDKIMADIKKNKNFSATQKIKDVEDIKDQIMCIVKDLNTKMDRLSHSSTLS